MAQLPGGYLCSRYGGRLILPIGVAMWSLSTALIPMAAGTIPGLCISRALVGFGEAVAPSSITDIVAKTVPQQERSRSISFIFGGLNAGSTLGLLISPLLIDHFNWPSVFYLFGFAGLFWVFAFDKVLIKLK